MDRDRQQKYRGFFPSLCNLTMESWSLFLPSLSQGVLMICSGQQNDVEVILCPF